MRVCCFHSFGIELDDAVYASCRGLAENYPEEVQMFWANQGAWNPAGMIRNEYDAIVIGGAGGSARGPVEAFIEDGARVVMLDLPRFRGTSQWRVGPPDLAWLPESNLPAGRSSRLGLEVSSPRTRRKNQKVLVLGQNPSDYQHGLGRGEYLEWLERTVALVRQLSEAEVAFRPHPGWLVENPGADHFFHPEEMSLDQCFDQSFIAITQNSNSGFDALIAGLPVVACGDAIYGDLSGSLDAWSQAKHPGKAAVVSLLDRVAWTHWENDELASGMPVAVQLGLDELPVSKAEEVVVAEEVLPLPLVEEEPLDGHSAA